MCCAGCLESWYCNVACQKKDWRGHKHKCSVLKLSYSMKC
jgi:hypothetical protein